MSGSNRELDIIQSAQQRALTVDLPSPQLTRFFVAFGRRNYRAFPWRARRTSVFGVLIAEVLLKQTKADDVVPIWHALLKKFPTPERLRQAPRRLLSSLLRPLGLQNQRAGALRDLASSLVNKHDGNVPETLPELLALPHVGMYTACAVRSFAFHARVPIVDSNIVRFFTRFTGIVLPRDVRRAPDAWSLAWAVLPRHSVALHNYGLLDFTGLVCTPRAPRCASCGLLNECAFGQSSGSELPSTATEKIPRVAGQRRASDKGLPSPA